MTTSTTTVDHSPIFSGNQQSRLRKRTLLFRYLAEINLLLGGWYLYWRLGHSINVQAWWLAIPLLLAELYSYLGGVMFTIGLWRPLERHVKSLDCLTPSLRSNRWSTVDVFVTCYNEPVEIVEQTTRSALAIDYPATKLRVYVLDDGNSPEMRSMAQRLGLEDLQSSLLQAEANRIRTERQQLLDQLERIERISPDAEAVEQFLQNTSKTQDHPATGFLRILHQSIQLLNANDSSVSDRLKIEQQKTRSGDS